MKNFWTYEDEDPYKLKSISERDIQKAEKKLGVKLPEEYKALILEQNGGYINLTPSLLNGLPPGLKIMSSLTTY
ncbi:hypothetical protein BL1202_02443 [Bacillus licheniformis]|nr:hypothetical protein BL1202_02443 [Bacillus licheniformis]EQM27679.1 hypothetical protein N399_12455 [Bacillus licheniformis CG-B52]KYC83886.1 hypothetical protein B4091_2465 [Bacillus licheniformis]